ncbi:MAG TPA: hypothetical protein VJQ25_10985 [Nitrospira sp.]|nr:hypothetical protein [Nitrospira sp.]
MSRISQHQSPAPGEPCIHCAVPVAKWGDISCNWRDSPANSNSRPIPPSGLSDFDFILGRIQEIKLAEHQELIESDIPSSMDMKLSFSDLEDLRYFGELQRYVENDK